MCGIIGIASNKFVTENIIQSLKKLKKAVDENTVKNSLEGEPMKPVLRFPVY